jgi:hypothetical protein
VTDAFDAALRQLKQRHGSFLNAAKENALGSATIYNITGGRTKLRTARLLLDAFAQAAAEAQGLTVEELLTRIRQHLEQTTADQCRHCGQALNPEPATEN